MRFKIYLFSIGLILLSSCLVNKEMTDDEIYGFLETCFDNYYENYDVDINSELNQFEQMLLDKGFLAEPTGKGYKKLLKGLERNIYFEGDLSGASFNEIVLYKNPKNLLECSMTIFNIDSTEIMKTNFAKIMIDMENEITTEEVSVHSLFQIYSKKLTAEELEKPYIYQSMMVLMYKWYYYSATRDVN